MSRTKISICAIGVILLFSYVGYLSAASLTVVRDLISTSAPDADTSHTIEFTATNAVPPSGSIVITPEAPFFRIAASFDYTDVDFAVGTPYVERTLGASATSAQDGVTVVTGSSGSITITLNSSTGIGAGEKVRIKLGTNAVVGETGDQQIENPSDVDSYKIGIRTRNASTASIDSAYAVIAVVAPVSGIISPPPIPPVRSNGLPSGEVAAGNATIEISLNTNEFAICRYATTTNVLYENMLGTFIGASNGTLHYRAISGHQDATDYDYYVRCTDFYGSENDDDYPISFSLADPAESETSEGGGSEGSGGSSGGGSGSGPGGTGNGIAGVGGAGSVPGGSLFLYLASVQFSGKTAPLSGITILRDGTEAGTVFADSTGNFDTTITGMERGTYTFALYSTDTGGLVSSSISSTLTLGQDTTNNVSNLIIPPTIALENDAVDLGESVRIFGRTLPGYEVEVYARKQASGSLGDTKRYAAQSTTGTGQTAGAWEVTVEGSEFTRGTYEIEARTVIATSTQSRTGFSKTLFLGVGEEPSPDFGIRADLNGDGKVNLVDFSIMLTFWNTGDADADINADGTVNLSDFSILLFNWTG